MSQQNTESVPASKGSSDRLREIYEGMLKNDPNTNININTIKKMILFAGVPDLTQEERDSVATKASLRGRLWKILLGVTHVDGKRYLGLVERVPCVIVADKIGNDVGRTFAKELDDTKKILSPLYRLLSAFAYLSLEESKKKKKGRNRHPHTITTHHNSRVTCILHHLFLIKNSSFIYILFVSAFIYMCFFFLTLFCRG